MNSPSDHNPGKHFIREKIIGLGEHSIRKSYYPQLQQRLEEVEQARQAIAESELRYRKLIESITDVIFSLDADGRFNYVSPVISQLSAWEPEQLIGCPIRDYVHPDDLDALHARITGRNSAANTSEFRFRGGDGNYRVVRLSCSVDGSDEQTCMLCDITEQRLAEAEKEQLQKQLVQTQKLESIGRLAGGIAHDFNNMLAIIMGNTELMLHTLPQDNPVQTELQEIFQTTKRASELTRQLLTFARKQVTQPKVFDLNDAIGNMLKMLQRLLGEHIDLAWLPGEDMMSVKMDPSHLDQVLTNLCINARDAIGEGGMLFIGTQLVTYDDAYFKLHSDEGRPGTFVQLSVTDDGCGMDQKTLQHIFEPFFTTKKAGEGTGLGLATVYGITKQNEGFITISSEPGQGTTFRIHLPWMEQAARPKDEASGSTPPRKGCETILVVEDEPDLLNMTERTLKKLGYRVLTASNPNTAIELTAHTDEEIHLLLTDIRMPHMSGIKMAEHIIALRPQIALVFMSGYADHDATRHGMIEKQSNFLQKPFGIKELADKLRELLEEK